MDPAGDREPENPEERESRPARTLFQHLLRMFETRMDAAGVAVRWEIDAVTSRLQLKLIAAGALLIALWAAVVLIAIALPPHLRIPVLSVVVAGFAIAAVWAFLAARRERIPGETGSMRWFVDGLKADLEVLARTAERARPRAEPPPAEPPPAETPPPSEARPPQDISSRSPPSDIAA
jgi:uncharacterized membrane protein YqjE